MRTTRNLQDHSGIKSIQNTTLLQDANHVASTIMSKLSVDNIIEIASISQTLNEFAEKIGCKHDCRAARAIIEKLRLDTSHFKRFQLKMPNTYIKEICLRSHSYYEMGQWLGFQDTGAFAAAKRITARLDLDTSHFHSELTKDSLTSSRSKNNHQWDTDAVDILLEKLCQQAINTGDWSYSCGMQRYPVFICPKDVLDDADYIAIQKSYNEFRIKFKAENQRIAYGYIYLITNKITGLQYVGQTTKTVEYRWKRHMVNGTLSPGSSRIDDAIQLYGFENFDVDTIDYCYCLDELNDKEIYWIAKYDCCAQDGDEKGYNWERGGGHCPDIVIEDENEICQMYLSGKSMGEIARNFGYKSNDPIKRILEKHDIELRNQIERTQWQRKQANQIIYMYDKNHNLIRTFNSQMEAGEWCFAQGLTTAATARNARFTIRRAILTGTFTYNAYWSVSGWTESEQNKARKALKKNEKTKTVKKKAKRQKELEAFKKAKNSDHIEQESKAAKCCPICGIPITQKATYCTAHSYTKERQLARRASWPTKEHLLNLAAENDCNLTAMGRILSRSSNSVAQILAAYKLPSHTNKLKFHLISIGKLSDPLLESDLNPKEIVALLRHGYRISTVMKVFHCSNFTVWYCCMKEGITETEYSHFKQNTLKIETQRPVEKLSLDGRHLKTYSSAKEAACNCGVPDGASHIISVCNGHRKTAYKWKWRWTKEKS